VGVLDKDEVEEPHYGGGSEYGKDGALYQRKCLDEFRYSELKRPSDARYFPYNFRESSREVLIAVAKRLLPLDSGGSLAYLFFSTGSRVP
jgi:hypothetical protein